MSSRLLDVNGTSLWLAEQGEGVPLVLSSGGPGCCDYLGPVAEMIDDLARVYRWEPRGCGRSSPTPPYDLDTTLADLESLRQALGHERWVVAGHSWGADLSLAYALKHPDRTFALIHLSGTGVQNDREWKASYEKGHERLPDFEYPPNKEVNRIGIDSWRRAIKEPALLRRLADLEVPALVVYGTADIRPSWPAEQLAHLLPNAHLTLIEGAVHCLWMTHPEELRHTLRAYLQSV